MSNPNLPELRRSIRDAYLMPERVALDALTAMASLDEVSRRKIVADGAGLVATVRTTTKPSIMEAFLAEYGLSTKEGLALMCLAEALLRVPDAITIDALIEDKILGGKWSEHAGNSISQLVNASTMGLQVTSAVLRDGQRGVTASLQTMVKRLGMPVIRRAVKQVMKELGKQFVLGQDITAARDTAAINERKGFTYSYDMLGEAALTARDAANYFKAYADAIECIALACDGDVRSNPGISIKLSALHPRYEQVNAARVMDELVPRVVLLAKQAKAANMGLNIDAEEVDRLDLSLSVIEAVLAIPELAGWDGFGIVVQAYSKRAPYVLDWLYGLATKLDRKIMVRLVKGAYWDAEIKRAQVFGLKDFPVFTHKAHSDISYIACAGKLFGMLDRIYPQFATHNAHTVAAIMHYAKNIEQDAFEFQRLHGMGESLHHVLRREQDTNCRIYAPVGIHRDLLAYLVRRLLENGANSSFVNQIVDTAIPPTQVAADPFEQIFGGDNAKIKAPSDIFGETRRNAQGWDITDPLELDSINELRDKFKHEIWTSGPLSSYATEGHAPRDIYNPADLSDKVGVVLETNVDDIDGIFESAVAGQVSFEAAGFEARAAILDRAADLFERHSAEFFALATREAGKSLADGFSELREAVDFLRFYAAEARSRDGSAVKARGVFICISPWNFPLAIFTGQISAALAAGNAVIAKPADATPLIAHKAVSLLLEAGIPTDVLHFVPGPGRTIGSAITQHKDVAGICFTGSTGTAQMINRVTAEKCAPDISIIAETGGLNAMIVDSTALPEQAIVDIIASSFQSAGQRCSALRMLYVQEDVYDNFLEMLIGAMEELKIGPPWHTDIDVGPVIDARAYEPIIEYCADMTARGKLLKRLSVPDEGYFIAPSVFAVSGIEELKEEIFGPVLHIASYKAGKVDDVVAAINAKGYGLTLGIHSRIDDQVEAIKKNAHVGNIYVNRNQIGAVVGSQPFGGEGLSGTGPKAGGPDYLNAFLTAKTAVDVYAYSTHKSLRKSKLQKIVTKLNAKKVIPLAEMRAKTATVLLTAYPDHQDFISDSLDTLKLAVHDQLEMPGPVGESNILSLASRGTILCLGSSEKALIMQLLQALYMGNRALIAGGHAEAFEGIKHKLPIAAIATPIAVDGLLDIHGIDAVALSGDRDMQRRIRLSLAASNGSLVPLIADIYAPYRYRVERHCCTDTTASGGDAALLSGL